MGQVSISRRVVVFTNDQCTNNWLQESKFHVSLYWRHATLLLAWDDISQLGNRCAEKHCSKTVNHRYFTSLKEVTKWYGLWEPYECVYRDLTNEEIQSCFSTKNIANIDIMGASISEILKEYLSQRIDLANDVPGSKKSHSRHTNDASSSLA
jgi:hypothetical protein